MENISTLRAEIKSILAVKAREGAKFQDVKDEYVSLMGKELCFDSAKQFNNFMRAVPDVYSVKGHDGYLIWYTKSKKSGHIATMVQKQKPPREQIPLKKKVFYNSTSSCYYNDNYIYKIQRNTKNASFNEMSRDRKSALFYNYDLIGDDFFLSIAHLDCKYKMERVHSTNGYKGRPIKKCGNCISGQYINDVTKMVNSNVQLGKHVILNIGSVDLLHGRDLIDMKNDFMALYMELQNRGIEPISTTLAPLANISYSRDYQMKWEAFNSFLLGYPNVLDLACCFLTNNQQVLFDCYQPSPKYVSGSSQAHLLWNFVGRQRVIKYLKEGIAEITFRNIIFQNNI